LVADDSEWCEDEDVWKSLGLKSKKDMEQNGEKGQEKGAMSSLRKAHTHSIHMHICKECESSATNCYPTQMGPLYTQP